MIQSKSFCYLKAIRILAFICIPSIIAAFLIFDGISESDIAIFIVVSIANSFLFPQLHWAKVNFLLGPLDRDHVDLFYYTLGMIGVGLFFMSENIPSSEVTLRERHARMTSMIEDLSNYAERPSSVFEQPTIRENLRMQIVLGLKHYVDRVESNRSECSPSNWDKYDFCDDEKDVYRQAKRVVSTGSFRRPRGRTCCRFSEPFERILEDIPVRVYIPSTMWRDANGVRLQSVFATQYLFAVPFKEDGTEEQMASFESAIRNRLSRVRSAYNRNKRLLDLETEFGAVSQEKLWASNIWPFILILALSTKIGRDRWNFRDRAPQNRPV